MNTIDSALQAHAAPTAAAARQDIAFTQRHAWMREYEHAEQARHDPTPPHEAGQAHDPAQDPHTLDTAAEAPRRPAHDEAHTGASGRTVSLAGAAAGERASASQAPRSQTGPHFTPAAAWLQPQVSARPQALPLAAAASAAVRQRELPAQELPARQVTVFQQGDTLSLTVRDSALSPDEGRKLLHELHANGATLGRKRVSVTLNGQRFEQHTQPPQE